jgi:single stranded DNA-binding protein
MAERPFLGRLEMTSLNKVMLIGNLGRKFELRFTGKGLAIAKSSLATNSRKQTAEGKWATETQWHQIVILKDLAILSSEKFVKGQSVMVEGTIKYSSYENAQGVTIPTTQILVSSITPFGVSPAKHADAAAAPASESSEDPAPPPDSGGPHDEWLDEYDRTHLATGLRPTLNARMQ